MITTRIHLLLTDSRKHTTFCVTNQSSARYEYKNINMHKEDKKSPTEGIMHFTEKDGSIKKMTCIIMYKWYLKEKVHGRKQLSLIVVFLAIYT